MLVWTLLLLGVALICSSLSFFLATNRFDFFSGRGHRETTVVSMLLQQVVPERCLITTDSDFGGYL